MFAVKSDHQPCIMSTQDCHEHVKVSGLCCHTRKTVIRIKPLLPEEHPIITDYRLKPILACVEFKWAPFHQSKAIVSVGERWHHRFCLSCFLEVDYCTQATIGCKVMSGFLPLTLHSNSEIVFLSCGSSLYMCECVCVCWVGVGVGGEGL